ncbi:XPG domain containing-domain-containing protein [Jackrogersella minutella]|nr:XPG domain containing-domain-containing protein [Jackrogersella minutella]
MGIRGFTKALGRYGVFSPLNGDTVVIDGPALVHRISDFCMKQRPCSSGFVCQPQYSLLSSMVIGWLDELKSYNVTVRKIYFDGYLPPSKWDVRQKRLLLQSRQMKALVASNLSGSPRTPEDAFSDLEADIFLRQVGWQSSGPLPKPSFMVPAVLEALKSHEDWGPLVLVVPGEADMFCAQDIRENGGTLLTSDSDLLIQDLGPTGSVSFLWEIAPADPASKEAGLVACRMVLHDINDRLGLANLGGLPRVAFEIQKGKMKFNKALQMTRDSHEDTLNSSEYQSFMEELKLKEYIPNCHHVFGILSTLDPRISEVVIQTLLLGENGAESLTSGTKAVRGPETLSIFLPILIENRDKRSAWTMNTNTRQIAYSVLQNLVHSRSSVIVEYRTLDPSTTLTGRQIEIPDPEEAINNCSRLVAVLKPLAETFTSLNTQWLAFAVYQDIEWSTSEQRLPVSAVLVNKATNHPENLEEYPWDLIHFTAQVQACLYSLRIGKQILNAVLSMTQDLPAPMQQLHNCLASLPPIAEWPTVESMFDLLSKFGKMEGLAKITDLLGIPSIKITELPASSAGQKKRQTQDHDLLNPKRRQKDAKRPPSINPYAILSQESED